MYFLPSPSIIEYRLVGGTRMEKQRLKNSRRSRIEKLTDQMSEFREELLRLGKELRAISKEPYDDDDSDPTLEVSNIQGDHRSDEILFWIGEVSFLQKLSAICFL